MHPVSGYVLAGGRSSRMGTDKAALPWRGSTLGSYVARQVLGATGSVVAVGARIDVLPWILDRFPGCGPVGAIVTALEHARTGRSLIVACDMPGISAPWLEGLVDASEAETLIPRTPDGRLHPLCAVWHASAVDALRKALLNGVYAVREAIRPLPYRVFDVEDPLALANVNTPEDWARFRRTARSPEGTE